MKKSIFKRWWFWVGLIIIVIIIGSSMSAKPQDTTAQPSATPASPVQSSIPKTTAKAEPPKATATPAPTPAPKPVNKDTITKAEFDQIKNGMTYEEVSQIIGGPGELLSESGNKGEAYHTVMYSYKGEGSLGANANFMFQENKLANKAQMGLK